MRRVILCLAVIIPLVFGCDAREAQKQPRRSESASALSLANAEPSGKPGGVDPSGDGSRFAPVDAIWAIKDGRGFSFHHPVTFVAINNLKGYCSAWSAGVEDASSQTLVFALAQTDDQGAASAATRVGAYSVIPLGAAQRHPNAFVAQVYFEQGCGKAASAGGVLGTVKITSISATTIVGTYDVSMGCSGFSSCAKVASRLTGEFSASNCDAMNPNRNLKCSR